MGGTDLWSRKGVGGRPAKWPEWVFDGKPHEVGVAELRELAPDLVASDVMLVQYGWKRFFARLRRAADFRGKRVYLRMQWESYTLMFRTEDKAKPRTDLD